MKPKPKNPLIAMILSAIVPGLGQAYNRQIIKGVLFLAGYSFVTYLMYAPFKVIYSSLDKITNGTPIDQSILNKVLIYSIISLGIWVYSIIDAKKSAESINSQIAES